MTEVTPSLENTTFSPFSDFTVLRPPGIAVGTLFAKYVLSLSLVVGDTLRLGRAGLLGCEGQHHQGDDVGHHIIYGAGDIHGLQELEPGIHVGQRPEHTEQQRRQGNAGGLPLAEDRSEEHTSELQSRI